MVRATFAGFSTALSALRMNQKKLDIVGQNLANMNTEGYTRQELKTSSINYDNPTSFYMNENDVNVGFGVAMDEVTQLRDQFVDKQYRIQNSKTNYNETISDSLKTLNSFLDETKLDGIRSSLDDIQTSLTNMQDPAKVQDPVYEGEFMSRVQAFTTLLNSAAESINTAKANTFQELNGQGTSENGAIQKINYLLDTIGQLNVDIKRNQMLGNPALELQDQRNLALDELAGYIPIEVESFSEEYVVDGETRYRMYNYDENGNVVGRSSWPEDIRVSLKYTENDGKNAVTKTMTLVNGSIDGELKEADGTAYNVGRISLASRKDGTFPTEDDPTDTQLTFTTYHTRAFGREESITTDTGAKDSDAMDTNSLNNKQSRLDTDANGATVKKQIQSLRLNGGSVQASLDMLSSSDYDKLITEPMLNGEKNVVELAQLKASSEMNYYSYDYYMDRLDSLAQKFAADFNKINLKGNTSREDFESTLKATGALTNDDVYNRIEEEVKNGDMNINYLLIINKTTTVKDDPEGITAANIGIAKDWVNGTTRVGITGFLHRDAATLSSSEDSYQGDFTDTVTEMLRSMISPEMRQNNTRTSYSDFMNNISTVLATDAYSNNDAYMINKTVLDGFTTSRDQLSGVSLDEEAANMMTYTTSYNAAARLMTALDETLQTLLGIGA